jgi:glycosyltransferase 2 family protein
LSWKKRLTNVVRIVLSGALVWWLINMISVEELVENLTVDSIPYVLWFIVMVNADRHLMAFKWNILLKAKGIRLPFDYVNGIYYMATLIGSFLLPTVGVDAIRAVDVGRKTNRHADVVSSIVLERAFGVLGVGVVCLLSLGLFVLYIDPTAWKLLLQLTGVVAVITILLLASLRRNVRVLPTRLKERSKLVRKFKAIVRSYQEYADHRWPLVHCFLWTIAEQLVQSYTPYIVSQALGFDIPLRYFFMFIPITIFVARLPISFDGFGVREGIVVALFGMAGVPATEALLISLIHHIGRKIVTSPAAIYFLLRGRFTVDMKEVKAQLETPGGAPPKTDGGASPGREPKTGAGA